MAMKKGLSRSLL